MRGAADPTAPVLPGETLAGKYKIERILGRGGMGIVVAARHLELDERVAIKFLLRGGTGDAAALERFLREARAAAKVKNEHVCRVFDVGRLESGEPYLVMEYLEGIDLADKLDEGGPLSVTQAASFLIEACAALAEAHSIGIVHRDLKPANIFLAKRSDGSTCVKVLDFGISKWTESDAMTATSALIGSPAYMSPEQIVSARTVDSRADIWSLGVVLHELVAGAPPFQADSVLQLSIKIREQPPDLLHDFVPDGAASKEIQELEVVIAKCLSKDPAHRYADMAALARALGPFADPEARRLLDRIRSSNSHNSNTKNNSGGSGDSPQATPEVEIDAAFSATMLSDDGRNAEPLELKAKKLAAAAAADADAPPAAAASPAVVGQVTLEPLSRAGDERLEIKKPRRWASVGAIAASVLLIGGISAWRLTGSGTTANPRTSTSNASAMAPTIVPTSTITADPSSAPSEAPSTTSLPPPAAAPVAITTTIAPTPKPLRAASSVVPPSTPPPPATSSAAPTQPPTVPAAAAPTPAAPSATPEASSRRKRSLDREDPYHH